MARMKRKSAQSGIVAVEMALLLPLLLLLTLGILEYGWMFLKVNQITNAARRGARVGITVDATTTDVQTAVANLMDSFGLGTSSYTLSITPGTVEDLLPMETLTVSVSVPYANIDLLGVSLIPVPVTLSGLTSMAKEGP